MLYEILYYFCQKGGENWEIMKKDWFKVCYDPKTDHEYDIKVCDECTKNHKEVDQSVKSVKSAFMPEK